jgi:adenylate cyclase
MGQDEVGTLERLKALRRELIDPKVDEHRGRIVKTTGDGILIEFPSVVEAVAFAVAVQREMHSRNAELLPDQRIEFRVGINTGDVILDEGDIHGDGVNVAVRLEALAEPGGVCVSSVVYEQVQGRVEVDWEDTGKQDLKNIARPVRVYRMRLEHTRTAPGAPALALPDKPSIAVLPFQNMSGDAEQEYFADGMVEEIITALSRIKWLFVIARNSSFTYRGQIADVQRIARELGVRYILEGSVRKAGNQVRITGQLIETETGAHLWADRFDGSLDDVFELQDRIASTVAGVIEPELEAAEIRRASARPTTDLTAYDLYLRALPAVSTLARQQILAALDLLEQAIRLDPNYGAALATAAFCRFQVDLNGWADDLETNRREALDAARQALEAVRSDPSAIIRAAMVLAYFGDDINAMMSLVDRALELNPNFALGWVTSGIMRNWAGLPNIAIEHLEHSLQLSPRILLGTTDYHIGMSHFLNGRLEEAAQRCIRAMQDRPNSPPAFRLLASCYAHKGQIDKARETVERLRSITPLVVPNLSQYRNAKHRELILSGLRLAAGEGC